MIASTSWDQLDVIGFDAIRIMLSILWQSSLLLGAAALLVFFLRRRSPAIRHRVWTAALLLTPLLPALTWLASQTGSPQLNIPIIPSYETASVEQDQFIPEDEIISPASESAQTTEQTSQTAETAQQPISQATTTAEAPSKAHPWAVATIFYTSGLALLLGLVSLGRLRLRRYTSEGQIVTNPRITEVFEAARKQLGLKRGCVIVEIDNLHAPLTYLTFHPVIAFPYGFIDELSDAELQSIALHELAHVKRNDPFVLNLASIIRAIFFFHPLVWLAVREIATLAEEAADNVVVEATEAPLPYAKMLTRLTEQLTHRMFQTELAVGIVFSKSALLRRIEAILSPRTDQLRHLSFGVITMTTILVLGSLVLATAMPLTPASPTASVVDDHAKGMSVRHIWEIDPGISVYSGGISRDGRYVSYVDWNYGNLGIRDLKTGKNRLLTKNHTTWASTGGWNMQSVISPDGKRIAYNWNLDESGFNGFTLRVCDMDGSNVRVLHQVEGVTGTRPFDWSPDGENILVHFIYGWLSYNPDSTHKLAIVSVDDGSVKELKVWKRLLGPRMASFSPDGKYVAFDLQTTDTGNQKDIFVIELSTGNEVAVVEHPANDMYLGWTPDGTRLLFVSDRTSKWGLWTIEISNGRPVGSPVLLKGDFSGSPVGFLTDGSYYFSERTRNANAMIATLDESGTGFDTVPEFASSLHVNETSYSDWSPDGQSLAYMIESGNGVKGKEFGIHSVRTGQERIVKPSLPLSFGAQGGGGPARWSADGEALFVFGANRTHGRGIYRVDIATGETRLIVEQPPKPMKLVVTSDGKALIYLRGFMPIIRHDLASGQEEEIHSSEEAIMSLDLSPDGNWLAFYQDGDSIVVIPAEGGEVREVVQLEEAEANHARFATWTPDGKHLLFSKNRYELWRVNIETGEQQQIGSEIPGMLSATMHPDGKRISYTTFRPSQELWVMENFLPKANK